MTTIQQTIEIELDDQVDVGHLRPEDLPIAAAHLPCAQCGRIWADHCTDPTLCHHFVRPTLPPRYTYVDQIGLGTRFTFVSRHDAPCVRTVTRPVHPVPWSHDLVELESVATRCAAAVHLLHPATVVRTFGAVAPMAA